MAHSRHKWRTRCAHRLSSNGVRSGRRRSLLAPTNCGEVTAHDRTVQAGRFLRKSASVEAVKNCLRRMTATTLPILKRLSKALTALIARTTPPSRNRIGSTSLASVHARGALSKNGVGLCLPRVHCPCSHCLPLRKLCRPNCRHRQYGATVRQLQAPFRNSFWIRSASRQREKIATIGKGQGGTTARPPSR